MSDRDKRVLFIGIPVIVLILYWGLKSDSSVPQTVSASVDTIPAAEKRLARLRQIAGTVSGKEQALASVEAELTQREKGLIQADTPAQAQAQLLQILRRIARELPDAVELRNTEMGQVKPFGDRYGEVLVAVNFEAGIEQLINFLSAITSQKELIGTTDLRIGSANPKLKKMPVRLTLSGLVRKDLIPDKKGASF